jgi:hypothetical protein
MVRFTVYTREGCRGKVTMCVGVRVLVWKECVKGWRLVSFLIIAFSL